MNEPISTINGLLITEENLWGELTYTPVRPIAEHYEVTPTTSINLAGLEMREKKKRKYLGKHCIPYGWPTEGIEEFPVVRPYEGQLPLDVKGYDERKPTDCSTYALHGFCYDSTLETFYRNPDRLIDKAAGYLCAIGPDFSVLLDGNRCDNVEAIRRNRYMTVMLQTSGIPTIQSASWGSVDSFNYVYDGLSSYSPTAIEHNIGATNLQRNRIFRLGVEELIKRKHPTVLLVVGFPLGFNPGVPVVYYKSRIQKLRNHEFGK